MATAVADVLVVQQSIVDALHRHIDLIAHAKLSIGPWTERSAFAAHGVFGVYAASSDATSWVVAMQTALGPLALVVWAMRQPNGKRPLVRQELIGGAMSAWNDAPPSSRLSLFWRRDLDPHQLLGREEAAFICAHELAEQDRVTAAIQLLRALVDRGLFGP